MAAVDFAADTPGTLASCEGKLNDFDPEVRREALSELLLLVARGELFLPPAGPETNLHCHSFFSFNAYGYSPAAIAWRARRRGLAVCGIVDFDVLHGLGETLECGKALNLRATCGLETRVFVSHWRNFAINSPREPGIAYFMGTGFGALPPEGSSAGRTLAELYRLAQERNKEVIRRVNAFLGEVHIEYETDVLPLTPSANPTERHIVAAYDRKAGSCLGSKLWSFWSEALGMSQKEVSALAEDTPAFQECIRAKLMKFGAPGYVPPEAGSFPPLTQVISMVREAGGLPTYAYLDGTSEAEADCGALLDFFLDSGAVVVNTVPARNCNVPDPELRRAKHAKLRECIEACRARRIPVIAGTEMNKYGQGFVDTCTVGPLAEFAGDFLFGGYVLYGHSVAAQCGSWTYFSPWAEEHFGSWRFCEGRERRNAFYSALGRYGPFCARGWERLAALGPEAAPEEILHAAAR